MHLSKDNDSSFVSYLVKVPSIMSFILVHPKFNLLRCFKLQILNFFISPQRFNISDYKLGRLIADNSS